MKALCIIFKILFYNSLVLQYQNEYMKINKLKNLIKM